ncbi:hypothetical protein EON80_05570 [bacterium]|nr:MAG: hypothetical protein EON80_05570 [bacterium]
MQARCLRPQTKPRSLNTIGLTHPFYCHRLGATCLMKKICLLALLLTLTTAAQARKKPGRHWVKPYMRADGTLVRGHFAGSGPVTGKQNSKVPPSFPANGGRGAVPLLSPPTPTKSFYPAGPTLDPSWMRQQRLEQSNGLVSPMNLGIPASFSGKCVWVTDGNTLRVSHGKSAITVLLYGVAAPTIKEKYWHQSKTALARLALGKTVTIYPQVPVKNGVFSGYVFVGRAALNAAQVVQGWARWDNVGAPGAVKLGALQNEALAARLGVWVDVEASAETP